MLVTLCIGALSFTIAGARKAIYEAEVSILLDPRGIEVLERDINPRIQSADGNIALIESMMRIMTSDRILARVVENENLVSDPEFNGRGAFSFISSVKNIVLGNSGAAASRDIKNVTTHKLRKAVGISRPKLSYVVELGVASEDPEKAAHLANSIAKVFLASELAAQSEVAQRAADSLSGRIEDLRAQLNAAENAVERYKLENNILNATGGLINEQELSQVNKALVEARDKTTAARVTLEGLKQLRASGGLPQTLPAAIQSQTIANLRLQLSQASQSKISLSAQYLDTHPIMRAAELRIKDVQQSIQAELDRIASAAQVEYNSALGLEKELKSKVTNLANQTYSTNDARVKLRELQREVDSKRVIYEAFLVRAKELGEQVRVDTSKARVVSDAIPPIKPAGLPSSILAVAGTGAGFGFACALALLGSVFFSHSPTNKMSAAGTARQSVKPKNTMMENPLSGMLGRRGNKPPANDLAPEETQFKLPVLLTLAMPRGYLISDNIPEFVGYDQDDLVAQDLAGIVGSISRSFKPKRTRTVLVTGIEDNFGKSVFASNLALAGALAGHDVMLAGADFESDVAVHDFSKTAENLLKTLTSQKLAVGQNVSEPAHAGNYQYWPLRSPGATNRLHKMVRLEKLRDRLTDKKFSTDLAVIDGPLLDAMDDSTTLSTLAHEVIVVLSENQGSSGEVHKLLSRLRGKRSRIRGIVKVAYTA